MFFIKTLCIDQYLQSQKVINKLILNKMSQYSWSKRYEIPDVCFKTEKNSYQNKGFQNKLRQTIDIASLRNEEFNLQKDKRKPSFTQSLRHTTDVNATLSDLLGKTYKYFEPRASKQKNQSGKNATFEDLGSEVGKRFKTYQSSSNSTWSESKFKSLKDLKQAEREGNIVSDKKQKLWGSSKYIPLSSNDLAKTPQRTKEPQQVESPYTFIKKNKFFYTTPQSSKEQQADQISTKFGSPTSSCDNSVKLMALKQVKKDSIQPPKLEDFAIIKHLGEGRFGAVSMAIHKKTGLLVAIKRVKKAVIKAHKLENQFIMQMKMQLFLKHPNILRLYGYFDDNENIYLILEFMEQGTLFNKLKKQKEKHFDEKTASQKMDDVLNAIKYMHQLEIAHRDIKPENIVMSNGVCKLCDFGWAAVCENRRTTLCGTIDYAPPEVLQGKQYGVTMDLWCLGVLCYELLVGKAPFYHVSRKQTMQKIIKADTSDLKLPEHLTKDAIDFISKLLVKDPDERMFAEDALKHDFIVKNLEKDDQKLRGRNK